MTSTTNTVGAPARACMHHNPRFQSPRTVQHRSLEITGSLPDHGADDDSIADSMRAADSMSERDMSWDGPELDFPEFMSAVPRRSIGYDPRTHSLQAVRRTCNSDVACSGMSTISVYSSIKSSLKKLLRKFSYKRRGSSKYVGLETEATNDSIDHLPPQQNHEQATRSVERFTGKPTGRKATAGVPLAPAASEVTSRKARMVPSMRYGCAHDCDSWSITAVMNE